VNPDLAEGPIEAAVSERRSSTWDIRNAPKNYLSLAAFQVASALFSFATVWVVTRSIGSDGYGAIVAVIAASQVAQVFVNWSSAAVVRFGVEEFIDTGAIARAFWTRFVLMAINLAAVALLGQFWFGPLAGWLKLSWASFGLVLAHFAVTAFWVHVQMALQGAKLQRRQGLLQMIERAAILAGVLLLLVFAHFDIVSVIACYIAAPAVVAAAGVVHLRSLIFHRFTVDTAFFKKLLVYSLPLLPFSLIGYFSGSYVDAVFIANFFSVRDLGIYAVATQMSGIALQFPTLATALLVPFFVSLDKEGERSKLDNYFRHALPNLTLTSGIAATLIALAGYFLIPMVFGREFGDASVPFWVLMTSTVMAIPVLCGYAPLTHARSVTYIAAIVAVVSAGANVAFNFMLIPLYGMTGCAWATVIAYLASGIAFAVLLRSAVSMPFAWMPFAILPSLASAAVLSWTANVWAAALVCLAFSFLAFGLERKSVLAGLYIMKRLLRT
jgi:O-antigen/teichoic acid export membrane protein